MFACISVWHRYAKANHITLVCATGTLKPYHSHMIIVLWLYFASLLFCNFFCSKVVSIRIDYFRFYDSISAWFPLFFAWTRKLNSNIIFTFPSIKNRVQKLRKIFICTDRKVFPKSKSFRPQCVCVWRQLRLISISISSRPYTWPGLIHQLGEGRGTACVCVWGEIEFRIKIVFNQRCRLIRKVGGGGERETFKTFHPNGSGVPVGTVEAWLWYVCNTRLSPNVSPKWIVELGRGRPRILFLPKNESFIFFD